MYDDEFQEDKATEHMLDTCMKIIVISFTALWGGACIAGVCALIHLAIK